MKILAIETSCDETAVSVLECEGDAKNPQCKVLGTGLYSQASKHAEYGGVYPNLAKREHQQNLVPMLRIALDSVSPKSEVQSPNGEKIQKIEEILDREPELLEQLKDFLSKNDKPNIDAIAVTQGPGLEPALWVGINFAKALSFAWNIPLVPVNHMEGHIVSVLTNGEGPNTKQQVPNIEFPAVALLVSGGHTELQLVKDWGEYELLGQTRDDAVGEAFDKVARLLDLPYPGGPQISKLAQKAREANSANSANEAVVFPRPMINTDDFDFSFSGLKTAVLYFVKEAGELDEEKKEQIAREFEDAAVEVLISKTKKALEKAGAKTLIVGGGVIANNFLREQLEKMLSDFPAVKFLLPTRELSTDNAVMIGIAGYIKYKKSADQFSVFTPDQELRAHGTLRL